MCPRDSPPKGGCSYPVTERPEETLVYLGSVGETQSLLFLKQRNINKIMVDKHLAERNPKGESRPPQASASVHVTNCKLNGH